MTTKKQTTAKLTTPSLPIARFRLHFQAERSRQLPLFAGSTWRGAFGHSLRSAVCITGKSQCADCLIKPDCTYARIFETAPPQNSKKMRLYSTVPHPFVLFPVVDTGDGPDRTGLELTLIGHSQVYLPFVLHALQQAGQNGLTQKRVPLTLRHTEQANDINGTRWHTVSHPGKQLAASSSVEAVSIPEPPSTPIRLRFQSQLRLRHPDKTLIKPDELQFADLFGNLLRRISMLSYFHTDSPLETDFRSLTDLARSHRFGRLDLRLFNATRHSSRQNRKLALDGILGTVTLAPDGIVPFWPYLWLGQWLHAGHSTSMGLGRYRIEPVEKE